MSSQKNDSWFSRLVSQSDTASPRHVKPSLSTQEKETLQRDRWIVRRGGHVVRFWSSTVANPPERSLGETSSVSSQEVQTLAELAKRDAARFRGAFDLHRTDSFFGLARTVAATLELGSFERNRVGAPNLARGPLSDRLLVGKLRDFLESHCRRYIQDTLDRHEIKDYELYFADRICNAGTSQSVDPSIVIVVRNDDFRVGPAHQPCDPAWFSVVDDIRMLLVGMMLSPQDFGLDWTERAAHAQLSPLKVEIISQELHHPTQYAPVLPTDQIAIHWKGGLRDQAISILENEPTLNGRWNSVSVLRFGLRGRKHRRITLIVAVEPGLDEADWILARAQIEDVLDGHNDPDVRRTRVLFERGQVDLTNSRDRQQPKQEPFDWDCIHSLKRYPTKVNMGADIGTAFDFVGADGKAMSDMGTLGGFIEITIPSGKSARTKHVYGVTNHHVIRGSIPGFRTEAPSSANRTGVVAPEPRSALAKADALGFDSKWLSQCEELYVLESPCHRKHEETTVLHERAIEACDKYLKNIKSSQRKKETQDSLNEHKLMLRTKTEFFNSNQRRFGVVKMSSGFTRITADQQKEDWALIEVPRTRVGKNLALSANDWRPLSSPFCVDGSITGTSSLLPWLDSDPASGITGPEVVYMICASTGKTLGQVSWIKTELKDQRNDLKVDDNSKRLGINESAITQEIVIIKYGSSQTNATRSFAESGDSGGWVFTSDGKWLALYWGGSDSCDRNASSERINYVTDAQGVIDGIRKAILMQQKDLKPKNIKINVL